MSRVLVSTAVGTWTGGKRLGSIVGGIGVTEISTGTETVAVGTIPIDALFSPIQRVNFTVSNARVENVTDYDKLVMEIWTDGSVKPDDALAYAAKIIKEQVQLFINFEEGSTAVGAGPGVVSADGAHRAGKAQGEIRPGCGAVTAAGRGSGASGASGGSAARMAPGSTRDQTGSSGACSR
ncbi:MAG: hypothetical protein HGA86_03140 [Anaerolineaceae bacterium]|nr:hypothetical protein [Anaerolineaceae bacterium]